MSNDIKHNRRSILGTAAVSIITAKMALMDTAHASFEQPKGAECRLAPIKPIKAGVLAIGYYEAGPSAGPPVLLLHGLPYSIESYVDVAPMLAARGCRVIVPYLRGHGSTRFLDGGTPRSGQQAAIGLFQFKASGEFAGGSDHFDRLHLTIPIFRNNLSSIDGIVNFTLPVVLPSGGATIDFWDHEAQSVGTNYTDLGYLEHATPDLRYPYYPGQIRFTLQAFWHKIGPSICHWPNEWRVTLQGHGVHYNGRWIVFW
jgi:alpha/beta hydrolase fold